MTIAEHLTLFSAALEEGDCETAIGEKLSWTFESRFTDFGGSGGCYPAIPPQDRGR